MLILIFFVQFIFTDVQNKYIFTTSAYGTTFNKTKLSFIPDEVTFDPNSDHTILAYEKFTPDRQVSSTAIYFREILLCT